MAPAVALSHPGKSVLLLDCSIQGDASVITLGGTGQPLAFAPGVRTRGAEVIAALPAAKTAAGFLAAVKAAPTSQPAPAPAASSGWGLLSRAAGTPPPAPPAKPFDWQAHSVNVSAAFPAGKAPPNLWAAPGGRSLYNLVPADEVLATSAALRRALASLGPDVIVIIDTDAELAERTSSLLGIAAAKHLCMVLTSSWTDYQRLLDDAANGLFAGLSWLETNDPQCVAKIGAVVFNNVQLLNKSKGEVCGSPGALPFTPPKAAMDSITDIVNHLHQMCSEATTNYKAFFDDPSAFGSAQAFTHRYVTGLATVPDKVWQDCHSKGMAVVVTTTGGEPAEKATSQLNDVAKRMLFE